MESRIGKSGEERDGGWVTRKRRTNRSRDPGRKVLGDEKSVHMTGRTQDPCLHSCRITRETVYFFLVHRRHCDPCRSTDQYEEHGPIRDLFNPSPKVKTAPVPVIRTC